MEFNNTNLLSQLQPSTIIYVLLIILLLSPILTILYNLSPLHPLSSYPGPLLSRAIPLPHAWRIASGRGAHAVHALHERYGPVVRVGPNHLCFVDVRAWRDIYNLTPSVTSNSGNGGVQKERMIKLEENAKSATLYADNIGGESAPNILNTPWEEHARLRKALAGGFSERAMRVQEGVVRGYVDMLIRCLRERAVSGKKVDLVQWYTWTAFDVVGDLVFAESFGCLRGEKGHPFVDMVTGMLDQTAWLLALRYSGLIEWRLVKAALRGLMFLVVGNAVKDLKEGMTAKLQHRLDVKGVRDDLFEGLMNKREEWNLSMDRLESNASLLVAAGSETTATQLSGVTYFLLRNPEIMEKLKHEIRSSFASPDEITATAVSRLPYLLACLNEALRICPAAPSNFAREVRKGGAVIVGKYVPENTIVEIQHYSMNHSSQHWQDPFTFRPERFLLPKQNGEKGDALEAFQPFSVGPRDCIGRNLAYAEMRLIIARIIYEFDLELLAESNDWLGQSKAYTVWLKAPLYVRLTPVKRD